jgi:hypothetical protein
MEPEIALTENNLLNVINFLKSGNIVCLHNSYKHGQYYYSQKSIDTITTQEIIYVDLRRWPSLLEDDEWPYYIKDSGFVLYTSHILPAKEQHYIIP